MFNKIFSILLLIAGIILSVYVGGWLLFVGGVKDVLAVINKMIDGLGVNGKLLGFGLLKWMLAGAASWFIMAVTMFFTITFWEK